MRKNLVELISKLLSLRRNKLFVGILIGTILVFVFWHFYNNLEKILRYEWEFNFGFLIGGILLCPLPILLRGFSWKLCLGLIEENFPYRNSLKFLVLSQPAKYLPGAGWSYLGQVFMCEREGINKRNASFSILLETVLHLFAGLLLFLLSLRLGMGSFIQKNLIYFSCVIVLGLALIHPVIFNKILNFLLPLLGQEKIDIQYRYHKILPLLVYNILIWLVGTLVFYFFIQSIYRVNINLLTLAGILAIGFIAGYFALFVPAGIGVREGVLVSLLQFYVPLEIAIMVTILVRFIITLQDVFYAGIATKL